MVVLQDFSVAEDFQTNIAFRSASVAQLEHIRLVIRRLWVRPQPVGNIILWRLIMKYFLQSFLSLLLIQEG